MSEMSHFDSHGASRMVDVGAKPVTRRQARARAVVRMTAATRQRILDGSMRKGDGHFRKGDVLEVARVAGIMATKRTADLIPLCHPLALDSVTIDFRPQGDDRIHIEAVVQCSARTGVEMEALAAVSVAALAIYDMCKAVDRGMVIEQVRLEEKAGGASGHFKR